MSAGAVLALALLASGGVGDSAFEREVRTRTWAATPHELAPTITAALEDPDWRRRAQALEALARSEAELLPEHRALVRRALHDDHPSVRAAALDALARCGESVTLGTDLARSLAADALPHVRAAFARYAGRDEGHLELLAGLARDPDARVREDARAELLVGEAGAEFAHALLVEAAFPELVAFARMRARGSVTWPRPASSVPVASEPSRGRAAVLAALALEQESDDVSARRALLDGWFAPELDLRDAHAFVRDAALLRAEELATDVRALWFAVHRDVGDRWPGALEDFRGRSGGAETASAELLRLGFELDQGRVLVRDALEGDLSHHGRIELLEVASTVFSDWEPEVGRSWLARAESDLRSAALFAVARAAARGDEVARDLLAEVLGSGRPDEAELAFRALCEVPDPTPVMDALYAYWSARNEATALELLEEVPRRRPPTPFREALLALGEVGGERRGAVLDLLETFVGDEGAARTLARWTEEEVELLARGTAPDRGVELRAAAALRALRRVAEGTLPELVHETNLDALERTAGRSTRVGKVAAHALGTSEAGRARLAPFLSEDVLVRTRIEAAIALAAAGDGAAARLLVELVPESSWDLASRMVPAIAAAPDPVLRTWLRGRALDPNESAVLRSACTEELAQRSSDTDVLELLVDVARGAPDVETMSLALRGLGGAGEPGAERLLELRDEMGRREPSRIAQLEGELRELVRLELLVSLAGTGHFPVDALPEVLRAPVEAARGHWRARLEDRELARATFLWSRELELFERLCQQGSGGDVLRSTPGWRALDGRLLVLLGWRAAETGGASSTETARELLAAGRIALAGELDPEPELFARARLGELRLALGVEHWLAAARSAERLLREWALGALPDRAWSATVGRRDVLRGLDPPARLASLATQCRARAALELGELERARSLAREAAHQLRDSAHAAEAQAELEARLRAGD